MFYSSTLAGVFGIQLLKNRKEVDIVNRQWQEIRIFVIGLMVTVLLAGCADKPPEHVSEDPIGTKVY